MAERILEGKVVMITGAGRGMGRTMSIALAEAGAKLAVIDVDKDVLAATRADVETAGGPGLCNGNLLRRDQSGRHARGSGSRAGAFRTAGCTRQQCRRRPAASR